MERKDGAAAIQPYAYYELLARVEKLEDQVARLTKENLTQLRIVITPGPELQEALVEAMKVALADLEQSLVPAQDAHGNLTMLPIGPTDSQRLASEWQDFSAVKEQLSSPGFPREGKSGSPEPQ